MKLGIVVIGLANAVPKCSERSEKRLKKITAMFAGWTENNCAPAKKNWMNPMVENIADKMLSHYVKFNTEICNLGARMGDEEDDLSSESCSKDVEKAFKALGRWTKANNRANKSSRLKKKFGEYTLKWANKCC